MVSGEYWSDCSLTGLRRPKTEEDVHIVGRSLKKYIPPLFSILCTNDMVVYKVVGLYPHIFIIQNRESHNSY